MNEPVEVEGKSLKQIAANWLLNQGTSTVLLFAIAAGVWVGGSYAIREGIPSHLKQIQDGYEKLEGSFSKDLDRVLKNAEDERTFHREVIREMKAEPAKRAATNANGEQEPKL